MAATTRTHRTHPTGPSGRRPASAVAAAAVCLAALAGCSPEQVVHSSAQPHSVGAVAQSGEISLLDVAFLFDGRVAGDEVYPVGGTAPMAVTIVNSGDRADRLVAVTSPVATGATIAAREVTIPGDGTVTAGQVGPVAGVEVPVEDEIGPIALTGLTEPIRAGISVPVVFRFERAGEIRIDVPVNTPDIPKPRVGVDPG